MPSVWVLPENIIDNIDGLIETHKAAAFNSNVHTHWYTAQVIRFSQGI